MKKTLLLIAVTSALTVIGCARDGGKRLPIHRGGATAKGKATGSERTVQNLAQDKDGLALDEVLNFLTKDGKRSFSIYTADLDFGSIGDKFTPSTNASARGIVALKEVKPYVDSRVAAELKQDSRVGQYLDISSVDDNSVTLGKDKYTITKRGAGYIHLKSDSKRLVYILNPNTSTLAITVFTAHKSPCADVADGFLKETYVITWGNGLQQFSMDKAFAQQINSHLNDIGPAEFSSLLGDGRSKIAQLISVPTATYYATLAELQRLDLTKLSCSK